MFGSEFGGLASAEALLDASDDDDIPPAAVFASKGRAGDRYSGYESSGNTECEFDGEPVFGCGGIPGPPTDESSDSEGEFEYVPHESD